MPKRVCLLVPLALFSIAACGDDAAPSGDNAGQSGGSADKAGAAAQAGAGSGAGAAAGNGSGGSGGAAGGNPGSFEEGDPCRAQSDCVMGLRCNASPLVSGTGVPIGVCGKACMMDPDCGDGAVCYSYSGMDRDKHCVDVIEEDYASCGISETSVCGIGRACLVFPDAPFIGVCVTLCEAGASDDDAGVPSGQSGAGCADGQTCIGGVLSDAPDEGVCGRQVARGEECGIDVGMGDYCGPEDVCAPDDIEDEMSPIRCYQACSRTNNQCDTGACILVSASFGYCI